MYIPIQLLWVDNRTSIQLFWVYQRIPTQIVRVYRRDVTHTLCILHTPTRLVSVSSTPNQDVSPHFVWCDPEEYLYESETKPKLIWEALPFVFPMICFFSTSMDMKTYYDIFAPFWIILGHKTTACSVSSPSFRHPLLPTLHTCNSPCDSFIQYPIIVLIDMIFGEWKRWTVWQSRKRLYKFDLSKSAKSAWHNYLPFLYSSGTHICRG